MFGNHSSRTRVPRPLKGLFIIAMIALVLFVVGNVIMFLWNNVLAEVTGVKIITFWQALGLFILSRILFGGFRPRSRPGRWSRRGRARRWREKWMSMTEEERAEFKNKWRERCQKKE